MDQHQEDRFDELVDEVTERLEAGDSFDSKQFAHYGAELCELIGLPGLVAV